MENYGSESPGGAAGAFMEDHRQGENERSYTPSRAPRQGRLVARRWRTRDSACVRPLPEDSRWFAAHPDRRIYLTPCSCSGADHGFAVIVLDLGAYMLKLR